MTKAMLAALVLAMSFSGRVFAQEATKSEGESTVKIEDAADKKNKVEGDIDEEITNKKLRAESGSKSKFSLSLDATFTGGGLNKPFDELRPDLYGRPGTQRVSSMTLGPDIRYRWTKNDSLTFGTSIGVSTPLQGDTNTAKGQLRIGDPGIGYSRVGKIGELQSIFGLSASYATSPESLDIEKTFDAYASWTLMRSWQNGLSLGLAATAGNTFYADAAGNGAETGYGQDDRADYEFALYPMAEYEINDFFSVRTVARYTTWYHYYGDAQLDRLIHYPGTQSLGIGMAISRDFYLYPNVQFLWEDLKNERTNIGATATINIF